MRSIPPFKAQPHCHLTTQLNFLLLDYETSCTSRHHLSYRGGVFARSSPFSSGSRTARNTRRAWGTGRAWHATLKMVRLLHDPHDFWGGKPKVLSSFLITSLVAILAFQRVSRIFFLNFILFLILECFNDKMKSRLITVRNFLSGYSAILVHG